MRFSEFTGRIYRRWRQYGAWQTLRFLFSRVLRHQEFLVFDVSLDSPRPVPEWGDGERVQIIGPENIDTEVTPELRKFLGGDEAVENLAGVRKGDRLFVVKGDRGYLHGGYIFFETNQTRILGETDHPPLIGCCGTAQFAQGRGLYRRALNAELCYLQNQGYSRALIETSPQNIPSRKGIEAAGFRLCREVSAWIMLNLLVLQKYVEPCGTKWRIILF